MFLIYCEKKKLYIYLFCSHKILGTSLNRKWNIKHDGISTDLNVQKFLDHLIEEDLDFCFNNKYDGYKGIFGTSIVESINAFMKILFFHPNS